MSTTNEAPTFTRRQLGRRLRQLREHAHHTQKDVETARIFSASKLNRIEQGKTPAKVGDVMHLCRFYGVDAATTEFLVQVAETTGREAWWEETEGVVADFARMYVELESSCATLDAYTPELLHGLLQTPDYARHIVLSDEEEKVMSHRLKLLAERQQHLQRAGRTLRFIVGNGFLTLRVGPPEILSQQIQHLCQLNLRPNIDIRFLPGSAGVHPGLFGRFTVLGWHDPDDPDVTYLETLTGARYLDARAQVTRYRAAYQTMYRLTVPIEECS